MSVHFYCSADCWSEHRKELNDSDDAKKNRYLLATVMIITRKDFRSMASYIFLRTEHRKIPRVILIYKGQTVNISNVNRVVWEYFEVKFE